MQWIKFIELKKRFLYVPMIPSIVLWISFFFSEVHNLEFLLKEQPEHKIIIKNKLNILFT